ncbi:barstar family protein [Hymenobacter sp. BT186]|uniref:Barstar family protein n=1 Tax=Hymenobacter telluris TaxID=2816474 RepID=A0A939F2I5_9BACT|nr:barstar family protein [Hymenobacter telluris]MBO0361162.1 barstar family protein [Hymenobacter telluris]MBW3377190.1 barstar family protein [Hymenobacter norwichensis]
MTLDLSGITTKAALHTLFKNQLGFPEWYGPSWDAFFDCIIAIVELPDQLVLINWQKFDQSCPKDMGILRQVIQDYEAERPGKRIVLA